MDDITRNMIDIFGEEMAVAVEPDAVSGTDFASDSEAADSDIVGILESESSSESMSDSESEPAGEWEEECPLAARRREAMPPAPTKRLNIENAANLTPIDYFKVIFNTFFLQQLASWINWHGSELKRRGNLKPQSRIHKWNETDDTELFTFLGILFYMGTVQLSKINDYWRKTHLMPLTLGRYMSRNRFLLILRCLYFSSVDVSQSIYSAIDPLIDYFNRLMKEIVVPGKELVIDESMVGFRGRLNIRQYIKNKRHKYGVKLYVLASPEGLVHRVHVYKGQSDSEVGGKGHVDKVVMKLLKDYLDAGYAVYMDNFYNSVNLAELLLSKKTYCTGTLLANRKLNPRLVTSRKLSRGGSIYRYNNKGVCVMKWKDKRDVMTISTEHSHEMVEVEVWGRQRNNGWARVKVSKPFMVTQYNKFMKGVDRHDQMLSYYSCDHKTRRWFQKVGIYILQTMLINSYFLFKEGTGKAMTLEKFREIVLHTLLPPPSPASNTRPPTAPTHMPRELPRNDAGARKRRKCVRCWSLHKKRKDSPLYCPDCDVGLCIACYAPHHLENNIVG